MYYLSNSANILLMFRWCHDIGREQAANRPLLRILFQVLHIMGAVIMPAFENLHAGVVVNELEQGEILY